MTMTLENGKVLKKTLLPGQPVLARKGSMLFYRGNVNFTPHSMGGARMPGAGAMAGAAGRMMQGEHIPLMLAEGQGEVYYGRDGMYIDIITMDGMNQLTVEASRLLTYDTQLQTSIVSLTSQGGMRGMVRGAVTGQGLFTTQISGQGQAAVLSHGGTIALQVGAQFPAVVVDPQAYVGHLGPITVELSNNVGFRDVIGRGSGEAMQLTFQGQGTVWVQASEQKF